MTRTEHVVVVVAVVARVDRPARQLSPRNCPGPSFATTQSRPASDRAVRVTRPVRKYITLAHGSPCEKIVAVRRYFTRALPEVEDVSNVSTSLVGRMGVDRLIAVPLIPLRVA
jgi:hypothetical protein